MHNKTNKLLRWKAVLDEYKLHADSGLTTTRIHKKYIYPKFFISIRTLNTILGTPVERELRQLGVKVEKQPAPVKIKTHENFYLQQ